MSEHMKAIKDNLLAYAGKKNYPNYRMAMECNISPSEFEQIIYGKKKEIFLSTVIRISNELKIPITVLIGIEKGEGK